MTHTILWRRLDLPGHDHATLSSFEEGWALAGTALFLHEQQPCKLHYFVNCDAAWRTTSARINGSIGLREIDIGITIDSQRRWALNGTPCSAVADCIDIDLGFTPATNLLPIRRLSLAVGQSAEVRAAWLPFPSLALEPLPQLYRREAQHAYHYESNGGSFVRRLVVNDVGFVVRYPGLWVEEGNESVLSLVP